MNHVTRESCPYPWDWAMITADGAVRPCCYGGVVGNLHQNDLEEIWNGRTMLELRYFIDHHRLHSVCQGAACPYSQARAKRPASAPKVADCRYEFVDVTRGAEDDNVEVAGRVMNAGKAVWFLLDDVGDRRIRVGARVVDPRNATTLLDLRCPMPVAVLFPGESVPFKFRTKRHPGAVLKIDVCNEGAFWFEDRGQKPLMIPL